MPAQVKPEKNSSWEVRPVGDLSFASVPVSENFETGFYGLVLVAATGKFCSALQRLTLSFRVNLVGCTFGQV